MFQKDLSDLPPSTLARIRSGEAKPVLDCDGNAIGSAASPWGAAISTLRAVHGSGYTHDEVRELEKAVVEHEGCYVIGQPT